MWEVKRLKMMKRVSVNAINMCIALLPLLLQLILGNKNKGCNYQMIEKYFLFNVKQFSLLLIHKKLRDSPAEVSLMQWILSYLVCLLLPLSSCLAASSDTGTGIAPRWLRCGC